MFRSSVSICLILSLMFFGVHLASAQNIDIEAEDYDNIIPRNDITWTFVTAPAGYVGTGAMQALPNAGINYSSAGYSTASPELQYQVNFPWPGAYTVRILGWQDSGADDSIHIGLDGQELASAQAIAGFSAATWSWSSNLIGGGTATLDVPTSGVHTLNAWMREDGFIVDAIQLIAPAAPPEPPAPPVTDPKRMEFLSRGLVAVKVSSGVYVGWRMFGYEDPATTAFNLYRDGTKLNGSPITDSTNYLDTGGQNGSTYTVRAVIDGVEQRDSRTATVWTNYYEGYNHSTGAGYIDIPLQIPTGGTTPDDVAYTYTANDCSVGDVDGDGEYEYIVKWDPTNSKDNAHSGYTGNVYLDAYRLDGTRLWRIDLGINIRAGAHYTQFMVWDLDGDGRAEVACKTAPGTKDGQGNNVLMNSDNPNADYRNGSGYILSGPEYLTIFDGLTGAELATTAYDPPRGSVSAWGDSYGNRVDRFLACVAYLDGTQPSLVMCRGYYTRTVLAAWDWRNGQLTHRWTYDSDTAPAEQSYTGQGNHQVSVQDIDADGRDEIIYGACVIDENGNGLYSTGIGHGDALHAGDLDPTRPGIEVFTPQEHSPYGESYREAADGTIIFRTTSGGDNGRGCVGDVDPNYPGVECWSTGVSGLRSSNNVLINASRPSFVNFVTWWDGELDREYSDGDRLDKWGTGRLISYYSSPGGVTDNNGTKSTPNLQADLFGDWREEMVLRSSSNDFLRIFTTTYVTGYRIPTLMHDPAYREAIAWQNVAYNQPPWPSYFLGYDMTLPVPQGNVIPTVPRDVVVVDFNDTDPPYIGTIEHPLFSLADAVAQVEDGGTIMFMPGSSAEPTPLLISRHVRLESVGGSAIIGAPTP